MGIKISAENGRVPVTIMHMDGNIDSSIYEAFQSSAQELIRGGTTYILVDLSNVAFVGSAGSRAIHSILSQLRLLHPDISEQEIRKGINARTYKIAILKIAQPFQGSSKYPLDRRLRNVYRNPHGSKDHHCLFLI